MPCPARIRPLARQLAEIGSINEADSIPSLEGITLGREARDPRSSDDLPKNYDCFHWCTWKDAGASGNRIIGCGMRFSRPTRAARTSAVEKLKPRDQHDYMPLLLSALGMPIEATYSVTTGPDGSVHYLRSLYREGADNDVAWDSQHSAIQLDLSDYTSRVDLNNKTLQVGQTPEAKFRTAARKANRAAAYQNRYGKDAAATESQVARGE